MEPIKKGKFKMGSIWGQIVPDLFDLWEDDQRREKNANKPTTNPVAGSINGNAKPATGGDTSAGGLPSAGTAGTAANGAKPETPKDAPSGGTTTGGTTQNDASPANPAPKKEELVVS